MLQGSFGAFVVYDLNEPFPKKCFTFPASHVRGQKRKRSASAADNALEESNSEDDLAQCKLCLRYNSMLHLDYVGAKEMLVVEQPWLSIVATFPAALQRKVYGS